MARREQRPPHRRNLNVSTREDAPVIDAPEDSAPTAVSEPDSPVQKAGRAVGDLIKNKWFVWGAVAVAAATIGYFVVKKMRK